MRVLIVDGANVVGSRPNGWWRDRAGAARKLHDQLVAGQSDIAGGHSHSDSGSGSESGASELACRSIVLVLEGVARGGQPVGVDGVIHTVHAAGSGDDEIVAQTVAQTVTHAARGDDVTVVTADRELRERVAQAGGSAVGPSWLLEQLT